MASAVEADVTCPICLELFNNPILLRCLHSLCAECSILPTIQIDGDKIQCPTCRQITVRADVVNDFKTRNFVELYRQLKAKEDAATQPTAPVASDVGGGGGGLTLDYSHPHAHIQSQPETHMEVSTTGVHFQQTGSSSKAAEAEAAGACAYLPEVGSYPQQQQPVPSLYPDLSPPPSYSEVAPTPYTPEPIDESSFKNFLNVELHPEEVFKFRGRAVTVRFIQQKAWVVLADGTIKIFHKTGYQFGKYIQSDIKIQQDASMIWSMVPQALQGAGSDRYVYKATAVCEAHNGDIIAACNGSANSWSFDSIGLVHVSNIGQVLNVISNKHYGDVRSSGQVFFALPFGKGQRKVEVYHQDGKNTKWTLQRKILVESGTMRIAVGHNWLFANVTSSNNMVTTLCKYDLVGKASSSKGKHAEYPRDAIECGGGSRPIICAVDPHGNAFVADTENSRLLLVDRSDRVNTIQMASRLPVRVVDVAMENSKMLLALTENENGIMKLILLRKA